VPRLSDEEQEQRLIALRCSKVKELLIQIHSHAQKAEQICVSKLHCTLLERVDKNNRLSEVKIPIDSVEIDENVSLEEN
jgi:hypothetical protein